MEPLTPEDSSGGLTVPVRRGTPASARIVASSARCNPIDAQARRRTNRSASGRWRAGVPVASDNVSRPEKHASRSLCRDAGIWRAEDNPQVIVLAAADCDAILATAAVVADEADDQERHLVLTERWQRYRLKVVQPVPGQKISYLLSADESLETRLTALQFFNSRPSGQTVSTVASPLRPTPYQSHRFLLMLKLLDALDEAAGKNPTTRELATILGLSQTDLRAIDWKTSSARRQTQRLVVEARQMAASGYRDLLSARGRRASQTP